MSQSQFALSDNPYSNLFWDMIGHAKRDCASDIHIQPEPNGVDVRFRIFGQLTRWMWIDDQHKTAFLQQSKQLSNCSLGVSGRAQDARLSVPELRLDLRASLLPSLFGEKLVLRLLDQNRDFALGKFGLNSEAIKAIQVGVDHDHGVALFTGPTGSGKSTLLYSVLGEYERGSLNIVTIEDPIEYTFPGITQVQVSPKLSMADSLRAILRQDPDIILVGEIRDQQTAELCFQAASTGHFVLSTLHANSAHDVAQRLTTLGVREDLLKNCLKFASAQRLLRKLCPSCKWAAPIVANTFVQNPKGCTECRSGLIGRVPAFEFILFGSDSMESKPLPQLIRDQVQTGTICGTEAGHAA